MFYLNACICIMCMPVGSLGTRVINSYELLYECWESNLDPLQEQQIKRWILITELSF